MKFVYFFSLIVALCQAQEGLIFCDDYKEYDITYYGRLISSVKLSNNTDAILTDYKVIIVDDELNTLSSVSIPNTTNLTCEWIFMTNPGLFFVGCQKSGESPFLIAYKKMNDTHYSQFGDIVQFPNLNSKLKKITGTLNTLFTVESTKVTLFTLIMSASDWSIKTTQYVLDNNYLGYTSQLNITDITFEPFSQDNLLFYKIILTEYDIGSFWVDVIVKNNILTPIRNGQIRLYNTKFQSTTIHSTTQNRTIISMTFFMTNYDPGYYEITVNSVLSTSVKELFRLQGYTWPPLGSIQSYGNVEAIMYRNYNKQTALLIYNVNAVQVTYENRNEDQISLGTSYTPVDKLTSPPQDYAIFYFNTGYRIVHSIENNKLQSCDLYNYKLLDK